LIDVKLEEIKTAVFFLSAITNICWRIFWQY